MIVLKATQDKVLSVLQSIAGIVERRHTLPVLAYVKSRKTGETEQELVEAYEPNKTARAAAEFFRPPTKTAQVAATIGSTISAFGGNSIRSGLAGVQSAIAGFFSASKANLRNAP